MAPVWIVIIVVTLVIAGMLVQLRRTVPPAALAAPRKDSSPTRRATVGERKKEPAAMPGLEWDNPVSDIARRDAQLQKPRNPAVIAADVLKAQRVKMRGRYLATRFPGVARSAADLLEVERIIRSARLYFEERKSDRAIELLDLAIAECPREESLPLARLEIAFLIQDAPLYVALAADFRIAHPSSPHWDEVARLGRAIAPEEAAFGTAGGPRASDHYGPWPDMPNWIQAPWDLTAEVRATEFHQAIERCAA